MEKHTICKIRDTYQAIKEFETKFEEAFNMSLNEAMLLCLLDEKGASTAGEAAEALCLTASNTSKVIRLVEDKGLLKRSFDKTDRRKIIFCLTKKGETTLNSIKQKDIALPYILQ